MRRPKSKQKGTGTWQIHTIACWWPGTRERAKSAAVRRLCCTCPIRGPILRDLLPALRETRRTNSRGGDTWVINLPIELSQVIGWCRVKSSMKSFGLSGIEEEKWVR